VIHPHIDSNARILVALVVLAVLIRLVFLIWADGTMVDDAYISLRHAQNLVEGRGFVYNEGERVLAVTGPLYGIWLAFLLLLSAGTDPGYLIGLTNIAFFVLAALGMWSLRRDAGTKCSIFILIIFSTFLRFVDNSLVGVETPLFLLAIVGSLILLKRGRLGWLSLVLGASVLIRPEGVLWAVSVLLVLALRRARVRFRDLVPGAVLLLGWVAFSMSYYGSPIPHCVKAKSGWVVAGLHQSLLSTFTETFQALSLLELPTALISSPPLYLRAILLLAVLVTASLFVCGAASFFRKRSVLMSLPVLFILYLASYLVGKGRVDFSWYGIPSGFAYMVTVVCGLGVVAKHLPPKAWLGRVLGLIGVLLALALITSSVFVWRATRGRYYALLRSSYERAGEFVDRVAAPSDRLLTAEVGIIGYRARRFVYGMGGIVSPEMIELYREHSVNVPISEMLKRFEPEFLVLDDYHLRRLRTQGDTMWVKANYETVAEFPAHHVLKKVE
jgi:hypothetical protein